MRRSTSALYSTSIHRIARSAKLSSEAVTQDSEPVLTSAHFLFPPMDPQKVSQVIFTGSMNFRISQKIVNGFHC